ncbi:putative geraniol 8-hydroxylase [Helianthus anomalus]
MTRYQNVAHPMQCKELIFTPKNLPPGPTRLPIIGNLHLLGDPPHQTPLFVISSSTAAIEVLKKQDLAFANRYVPVAVTAYNHDQHSLSFPHVCTEWRTLRRIVTSNIFSNNSLEAKQHLRNQKVEELVAYCRKASLSNENVDIGRAAFRTSLNLLSNTIFSKDLTYPYEDSGKEFKEVITNIMEDSGRTNLVDVFLVLKKIDPQGLKRRMTRHFTKVLMIFDQLIEERLRMCKFEQGDVLDVCLKMMHDNPKEFNHTNIKSLFLVSILFILWYIFVIFLDVTSISPYWLSFDLFVAGTDTTSITVEWAMAELLRKPHIMTKAKEELEKLIGKGTIVKEDDVSRLPYVSCIVKEVLRLHPPAPLLLPRKVVKEVQLNGYTILAGTQVFVNAWAIGRDPTVWDDSLEFKPQRFLESGLDVRGQDFDLIPFGVGRRICPGVPLATRLVPIMFGSLLNNFDWKIDTKVQHDAY